MKRNFQLVCSLLLVCTLLFGLCSTALAASTDELQKAMDDTAKYTYETVKSPQVGSIGGEWAVIGLARSGYSVPEQYYQDYIKTVEKYVTDCKGVLHDKKYTEYSRVIVALAALGQDARDVAGYDLTLPLGDYEKTIWQGLNGPIWALIALDTRDYPMPQNKDATTQATRQMYVDRILACQLTDGGWSLTGGTSAATKDTTSDPDITGMALQALANYQDQPKVKEAINKALDCMSKQQSEDGGFASWGEKNSESCVQMAVALATLGISQDDARFVKNGHSILDALLTFYTPGKGFIHVEDGGGNSLMSTEQGLYALAAVNRANAKQNALYDMSDAKVIKAAEQTDKTDKPAGNDAINTKPITKPGATFPDITDSPNKAAIEALAAREIINGDTAADGSMAFRPNDNITRAEFAAIVVRALGLETAASGVFTDVPAGAWYAAYVDTANKYGIVNGTTATTFEPNSKITRQEAAAMAARAAGLCGMENKLDTAAIRDILAGFGDYVKLADYAKAPMAFCLTNSLLDKVIDDMDIQLLPAANITRAEMAQIIYNLLAVTKLLY